MDILSLVTFSGGLAFFLYGMSTLSSSLERIAGGKLDVILRKLTSKKFAGLLAGALLTVAMQSSSALTVMLVGLVSSGMIEPASTVGIIMGSNIGTTLTSWILAGVGIESGSAMQTLFKVENFSLILALMGAGMLTFSKKARTKDTGTIFVGFAVLMTGMKFMTNGASPLASSEKTASLMTAFENPLLALVVGTVFTGIIQSSAASVGILQAIALSGKVSFAVAIPVVVGQNIGTCVTPLLSSIGAGRKAKKVTLIHVLFNIFGGAIFLGIYYVLRGIGYITFSENSASSVDVALIHTTFNLCASFVLFPFSHLIVKLCDKLLPESEEGGEAVVIPAERLLATPFAACSDSFRAVCEMSLYAKDAVKNALGVLFDYEEKSAVSVKSKEKQLDKLEDELGGYLIKLSKESLSPSDSVRVSGMLRVIADFERLGDHAHDLVVLSENMKAKKISFSEKTLSEISVVTDALCEIADVACKAFASDDIALAKRVEPLEEVIDLLVSQIRDHHVNRLREGITTLEKGFVLSDMLIGFERISDHFSNVALCVISLSDGAIDSHAYLRDVRMGDAEFVKLYDFYNKKYSISFS